MEEQKYKDLTPLAKGTLILLDFRINSLELSELYCSICGAALVKGLFSKHAHYQAVDQKERERAKWLNLG